MALNVLNSFAAEVTEDPRSYLLGKGPLESIIPRLLNGELNREGARELTSRSEVCVNLSPAPGHYRLIAQRMRGYADARARQTTT